MKVYVVNGWDGCDNAGETIKVFASKVEAQLLVARLDADIKSEYDFYQDYEFEVE